MSILFGGHAAQNNREQHGYRFLWSGVQPANVAPPPQIANRILVRQELPWHPQGHFFRPGVQGPNVRPPVRDAILTRQELPDHPRSQLRPGVQGPNVAVNTTIANRVMVRQELPWHPRSLLVSAPPPVRAQLPFLRPLLTTQEMPSHPRSAFHAGTHPMSYEDIQVFTIH